MSKTVSSSTHFLPNSMIIFLLNSSVRFLTTYDIQKQNLVFHFFFSIFFSISSDLHRQDFFNILFEFFDALVFLTYILILKSFSFSSFWRLQAHHDKNESSSSRCRWFLILSAVLLSIFRISELRFSSLFFHNQRPAITFSSRSTLRIFLQPIIPVFFFPHVLYHTEISVNITWRESRPAFADSSILINSPCHVFPILRSCLSLRLPNLIYSASHWYIILIVTSYVFSDFVQVKSFISIEHCISSRTT